MEIEEVQARILKTEFDALARLGVEQTSPTRTPILSFVLIPLMESENGSNITRSNLFEFAHTDRAVTAFEFAILGGLFAIGNTKNQASVEERIDETCLKNDLTADNLRRRIRPRIIEKIANYYARRYNWIMNSNIVLDKSHNSINIGEYIKENTDRICRQYKYSIQIERQKAVYDVITDYRRTRLLPNIDHFNVHICRTYESMQAAARDPAIIGLELAELSQKEWNEHAEKFDCSLTLMGKSIPVQETDLGEGHFIFTFQRPQSPGELDVANVICHYKLGVNITRFPVKLINHFTTDGVEIDFSIRGKGISNLEYADYFAGFDGVSPLLERSVNVKRFPASTGLNGVSVSIPNDTLLFPGGGIEFFWDNQ